MAAKKDDDAGKTTEPTVNPLTGSPTPASTTDPKQAEVESAKTGGQRKVLREEDEAAASGPQASRIPGVGAKPAAAAQDTNTPIPEGKIADAPVSAPFGPLGKPVELKRRAGGRIPGSLGEDVDRTPASRNPAFYSKEASDERARLTGDGSNPAAPTEPRAIGGGAETTAPVSATEEELNKTPEDLEKEREQAKQPA